MLTKAELQSIFKYRIHNWEHRANQLGQFSDTIIDNDLFELLEYFDYKCVYCNTNLTRENLEFDHAIPLNKEYASEYLRLNSVNNIVCSCTQCNRKKGSTPYYDFAPYLTNKIEEYFTKFE